MQKPTGIQLVDGRQETEGKVEILHNGIYGTICDENFDDVDAQVVCRMLGFKYVSFIMIPYGQMVTTLQVKGLGVFPGLGSGDAGHVSTIH